MVFPKYVRFLLAKATVMRRHCGALWVCWGVLVLSVGYSGGAAAWGAEKIPLIWWHAMSSQLAEAVETLVRQFNASQSVYEVRPVYKGTYGETLSAALAAYHDKQHPHLVQVFDIGTQTMLLSGAVYPVYQLMDDHHLPLDWQTFIQPVLSYYARQKRLYSMPFNASTPILYYNKDAFARAGLDPTHPPTTWQDVAALSTTILRTGAASCGFSVGWPSWTMLENMFAWHNQPFATKYNGFMGLDVKLLINSAFGVKHIGQLAAWQASRIFRYGGRENAANVKFSSGECAMYMQSSALIGEFRQQCAFPWGTGPLPHWGVPYPKQNSIVGGATLWVMKGHTPEAYAGVAQFLQFLATPMQQAAWHRQTGYLAISQPALDILMAAGYFQHVPVQWTAFEQLTRAEPTVHSRGVRLGDFVQIREIIETELEQIFAGNKTAQRGLDDAVHQANTVLQAFATHYGRE